MATTMRNC